MSKQRALLGFFLGGAAGFGTGAATGAIGASLVSGASPSEAALMIATGNTIVFSAAGLWSGAKGFFSSPEAMTAEQSDAEFVMDVISYVVAETFAGMLGWGLFNTAATVGQTMTQALTGAAFTAIPVCALYACVTAMLVGCEEARVQQHCQYLQPTLSTF